MEAMHGWMGKTLIVDLTSARVSEIDTQPYTEEYVGGRGMAARLYWEMADPGSKPFDPENPLAFAVGPLVASGAQAATVMSVVGKSPAALPESYCYGNIAGSVGAELKKAGYDGMVVTGRAADPVYLWIDDGRVEIREASALWGMNAYATAEALHRHHGGDTKFIAIGLAGENLIRTATAFASNESALSCGFGAVMGSKNLKAILIRGSRTISVADPHRLRELNRHMIRINKRLDIRIPIDLVTTGHDHLVEIIGKGGCYLCGSSCLRSVFRCDNRLTGLRHCQTTEYYLPWRYGRDDEPPDTFFNAPTRANDYGLDTFELRTMINWLYRCREAGVLTDRDTGLPLGGIGTADFLETLLRSICKREGFGEVLAEGMARAAGVVSPEARVLMGHGVAPIGEFELLPPRVIFVHALLYPMEPRVFQPLIHDTGFVLHAWSRNQKDPAGSPITSEVVRKIATAFWGSEEAGNLASYEGKALAAKLIHNRVILKDALGLCDFTWPIIYSFVTPDHVGDPGLEAKLYSAVTGRPPEELERGAEIIANLQRVILIREGRKVPEADRLPDFHFSEPFGGPEAHFSKVPGQNGETADMTGNMLDRPKYEAMLHEYYGLRGWDESSGIPRLETLTGLGMEDVAAAFPEAF